MMQDYAKRVLPLMERLAIRLSPQAGKSLVIPNPRPLAGEGVNVMPLCPQGYNPINGDLP